jgi:hypothetical protein
VQCKLGPAGEPAGAEIPELPREGQKRGRHQTTDLTIFMII